MQILFVLQQNSKFSRSLGDCVIVELDMCIYLVPLIVNYAKEIAQIVPLGIRFHVLLVDLSLV